MPCYFFLSEPQFKTTDRRGLNTHFEDITLLSTLAVTKFPKCSGLLGVKLYVLLLCAQDWIVFGWLCSQHGEVELTLDPHPEVTMASAWAHSYVSRVLKYNKKSFHHFKMSTWWVDCKYMHAIEILRWLFELPAR